MGGTAPRTVSPGPTRREVLAGAGMLAGAGLLVACGAGATSGGGGAGGGGGGAPGGRSPGSLAAVADVPVGGAVAATLDGKPILLTQATAGTIVGLSAICTHQGCVVRAHGKDLQCPCHGSVFGLDGSNVSGPAPTPLPAVPVHVAGGQVLAGAG